MKPVHSGAEERLGPQELAFLLCTQCAEARFGFEQALECWPDNQDAKTSTGFSSSSTPHRKAVEA